MKRYVELDATKFCEGLAGALLTIFTLVMLACMIPSTSWGAAAPPVQLLNPVPVFQSLAEGTGPAIIDFKVKNNTNQTLILDYAFCAITHGGPDTDDYANFTGQNGNGGLLSGSLILAPNQIGDYIYSFTSPGDGPETDNDFGLDPVTFSIEMSPLGNHTPPPINNISSAIGFVAWVDQGAYNPPILSSLNKLLNLQNPQPGLLYANGIIGNPQWEPICTLHDQGVRHSRAFDVITHGIVRDRIEHSASEALDSSSVGLHILANELGIQEAWGMV